MSDLSAGGLLECFHRYLDSEARFLDEVAPGVYDFCGSQVRAGSSLVDVACGTYRHGGAGTEYEIVAGRLLSIDAGADGGLVTMPASPQFDHDRRFELCGAQPEP